MASVISVLAKIQADTSSFTSGMKQAEAATVKLEKQAKESSDKIERNLKDSGKRGGSGFASSLKGFLGPALFAGGIAGAIAFGKSIVQAAEAERASNNLIENIVTSMGQFEGQTAAVSKRIQEYATTQAMATGIDEDAIKASQAKLLTFSNIASEAGKTGGQFDRATQAAMDLNAAGFGDMQGNAIRLGKALQDPIKGVGALARTGVTFSASQKEMIASLVASGDSLKAQDMILKAVEMQVGGAANATVSQSARMKVAFGELKESLGNSVLPAFDKMGKVVNDKIFPALIAGADKLPALFATIGTAVGPTFETIGSMFAQIWTGIQPAIASLAPVIGQVMGFFSPFGLMLKAIQPMITMLVEMFNSLAATLGGVLAAALPILQGLFTQLIESLMVVVNAVLPPLMDLFGVLGPLMTDLFTSLGPSLASLGDIFGMVADAIAQVIPPIMQVVTTLLPPLFNIIKAIVPPLVLIAKIVVGMVVVAFKILMAILMPIIQLVATVIGGVVDAIAGMVNWLMGFMTPIYNAIIDGINLVLGFLGQKKIPKMDNATNIKDAKKQGQNIGEARAEGEDKGYKNRSVGVAETGTTPVASSGAKTENPMVAIRKDAAKLLALMKPLDTTIRKIGEQEKAVIDTSKSLQESIVKAFDAKGISGKQKTDLMAYVKKQGKALQLIARQRDVLADKIKASQDKLDKLVSGKADFAKSLTEDLMGQFDISALGGNTAGIIENFQNRIAALGKYQADLKKLRDMGISDTLYKQILASGQEAGSATVAALLEGGGGAVAQINALAETAGTLATEIGVTASNEMFDAGINVAQGLLDGLMSKDAALTAAASKIASNLTAAVKKQLGIKSPSKVFAGIGDNIGVGLANGIDGTVSTVSGAVSGMMGAVTPSDVSLDGGKAFGGSGTQMNITINAGAGANGADIGKALVTYIKGYERQNGPVWKKA